MMRFRSADDGSGNARCVQHPGEGDLRVGYASFLGQSSDPINDLEIGILVIETVRETIGFSTGGFAFFLGAAISSQKASG